MPVIERDQYWMERAFGLAQVAAKADEVPVGAVLVLNDTVIGEGYNQPISHNDPCAHAEILAMRAGAEKIGNYRLMDAVLYVTLEPCMMCAGAMVHARIKRLVYGANDPKAGVIVSRAQMLDQSYLNHRVQHQGGVLAEQCGAILSQFFKSKR